MSLPLPPSRHDARVGEPLMRSSPASPHTRVARVNACSWSLPGVPTMSTKELAAQIAGGRPGGGA